MASYLITLSNSAVPLFVGLILLVAKFRGVKVHEVFVQGAAEGFDIAIKMIPYLVAMLTAIGAARTSGLLELVLSPLQGPLTILGFPSELLPIALMRPLSGSASFALMVDALQTYGPDSLLGLMASTLQGATDTTFYILAVYFGSVGVKRFRYAPFVGLIADLAGITSAVLLARLVWG
ncbi:MAG: spore maturation protein [Firmicutes bacterium]|jgi:spore maturation protein B|nr:spore maturation protein [Bacillota bacterium]